MKLLLNITAHTGLQYHRQIVPHQHLCELHPEVDVETTTPDTSVERLKQFDAIHFLRNIGVKSNSQRIVEICKEAGLKIIYDLDDSWELPSTHPMKEMFEKNKIAKQINADFQLADVITTTTTTLANKIAQRTDTPIHILPNCLDATWLAAPTESDVVRFGWIGGIYHRTDTELLRVGIGKVYEQLSGFQFACSFGSAPEYIEHEKMFSNRKGEHAHYKRLNTLDVFNYSKLYNEIDVALVPLRPSTFSSCKSELKIVEAGMMGKAVIASRVPPYDCFPDSCVMFVNPGDVNNGWFDCMEAMIDKDTREQYASNLTRFVKSNYDLSKYTKRRFDIYNKLINEWK